jgi:hypothetical protein
VGDCKGPLSGTLEEGTFAGRLQTDLGWVTSGAPLRGTSGGPELGTWTHGL